MKGWIDSGGWIHCPICGNKTRTKVKVKTVLKHFPLFCPKCKNEMIIDVENTTIYINEPDVLTQSR